MNPNYRPLKRLAQSTTLPLATREAITALFAEREHLLRRIDDLIVDRDEWIERYVLLKEKHGV